MTAPRSSLVWLPPYSWCPANFGRHRGYNCPMPIGPGLGINLEVKPELGHIEAGLPIKALAANDSPHFAALLNKHHVMLGLPEDGERWVPTMRAYNIMRLRPNFTLAQVMAGAAPPRFMEMTVLTALRDYLQRQAQVETETTL